jgi:hypothetical protein
LTEITNIKNAHEAKLEKLNKDHTKALNDLKLSEKEHFDDAAEQAEKAYQSLKTEKNEIILKLKSDYDQKKARFRKLIV